MKKLAIAYILSLMPIIAIAQGTTSETYIRTGPTTNISFVAPQAGATLVAGQPYKIQWNLPVENYSYPITLVKISDSDGFMHSYGTILENKTPSSATWTPDIDLPQGNDYKLIFDEKYGNGWAHGESGVFAITNPGSIPGMPTIKLVQSPAEDPNILHPGERAVIYGSGFDISYKVKISGNSHEVTSSAISTSGNNLNFIVPNIPGGTYNLFISNGQKVSNSLQINVVTSDYFPVSTSQPGIFEPTKGLTDAQKEAFIQDLQSKLRQLLQQLIILLQQQAAAVITSQTR